MKRQHESSATLHMIGRKLFMDAESLSDKDFRSAYGLSRRVLLITADDFGGLIGRGWSRADATKATATLLGLPEEIVSGIVFHRG